MTRHKAIEANTIWSKDTEHLLPKITSLILEGVNSDPTDQFMDFKLFRNLRLPHQNGSVHQFRPPFKNNKREISISKMPEESYGGRPIYVTHHHLQIPLLRRFIGGLSHCYNNLLMGIWGNTSLLGMLLEKEHPFQSRLAQIESLIQNGSSLIHLLLGYLVERRTATRKLRLHQLLQEIKSYNKISGNEIDFTIIESSIIGLSNIQNRVQLAGCMARIMDQMLTMVQEKRIHINAMDCTENPKVVSHLEKIDELLMYGFQMIRNLDYYAETIAPQKRWTSLKSIVRNQAAAITTRPVTISQDLSASIPQIDIDSCQIAYALRQLVDNALDAVFESGKIHIQLDTINSEKPQERCGVHMLNNYAVITVSDNGMGISTKDQAKIFDPFYTGQKGTGKLGLGLAAAAGIIKSHGGYVQVRSKPGTGSIFKLYLPI